jgi:hypothetical protein
MLNEGLENLHTVRMPAKRLRVSSQGKKTDFPKNRQPAVDETQGCTADRERRTRVCPSLRFSSHREHAAQDYHGSGRSAVTDALR